MNPRTKIIGASILLTALLSSGAMPALAESDVILTPQPVGPTCTLPIGASQPECPRPQLTLTQAEPYTAGTEVLIEGSGFVPGEQVSVVDRDGPHDMTTVAAAGGTFRIALALPDYGSEATMFSAIGAVSNYETESFQLRQERANIVQSLEDGLLHGWYPGEELIITLGGDGGEPYPSRYASPEGTSDTFLAIESSVTVVGKQSGGFWSRGSLEADITPVPRPGVKIAPPITPDPVVEVPVVISAPPMTPEITLETPAVVPDPTVQVPAPEAPAPSRPQPQAAVASVETEGALLATGVTAAALLACVASFLGIRRLRIKNYDQ